MTQKAQALALAEPDAALCAALDAACQSAGYELVVEPSAEVATSKLSAKRFDALVLDMTTPGAALVCMKARGKLVRTRIPVIAVVEEEDEVAFARAYRAGADEVLVASRPAALTSRLRSLPKSGIPQPGTSRGDAVVADADRARAEVLERVLRDAGFRVELAVDGFAARLQVGRPALKLAVLDASLDDAPALIAQARTRGARCAWIVRGRPDGIDELRAQLAKLDRVAVVNAYGPPDDVLFEANRLLEPRHSDGRADPRLLYGTIISLRWEGRGEADIGYAYNVSSVGLFIRTLAAPMASTVELELLPPGTDTRVRLQGDVIWRREFGATRREPVPAGFAVKITGGDVGVWSMACPRARSMPPRSILPVPESEMPTSAYATVRPETEPRETVPAEAVAEKVVVVPKRPSSADKLRLPERLRGPATGAFVPKPKEPSPVPPKVTSADPGPAVKSLRETQSSVEEMLLSVLSGSSSPEDALGAAPLSIDGGEVVELDKPGMASERPPSEKPERVPSEKPRPPVDSPSPVSTAPPPAPSDHPAPTRVDSPTIEVHGTPTAAPPRVERRAGDSDAPTIQIHRSQLSAALPTAATESAAPPRPTKHETAAAPKSTRAPEGVKPSMPREPTEPEALDPDALESIPPQEAAPARPPQPETSVVPRSLDVESRDFVPNELEKVAVAPKAFDVEPSKPSDPLAATVRAATSPFPAEAVQGSVRPDVSKISEKPQPTPSPVPPSASNIEPDEELEIPKSRSSGLVWLSIVAVGGGVAAFFAVPLIRGMLSSPAPAVTPSESAPSAAATAAASQAASAAPEPEESVTAPVAAPEVPSSAAALASANVAEAPVPSEAPPAPAPSGATAEETSAPAGGPGSSEEPDPAALASLEKGTGFLFVASSLRTNVYLYGVLAGRTNQRLVSKCGPRFIRLGTAPGAWQSDGVVSIVKCGGFTRVQIAR